MEIIEAKSIVETEATELRELIAKMREQLAGAERRYLVLVGKLELIGELEAPKEEDKCEQP